MSQQTLNNLDSYGIQRGKINANFTDVYGGIASEAATARAAELAAQTTANAAIPATQKGAASGVASLDGSSHIPAAQIPAPTAATLGGVQSAAAVAHQYVTSISTAGVPVLGQPSSADLSDLAAVITTPIANNAAAIATNTAALTVQSDNTQIGTTYAFALTDAGQNVDLSNAAAIAATIPPHSTVAFPVGTLLYWTQAGAGVVTVGGGAGVTLTKRASYSYSTSELLAGGYAYQVSQDNWRIYNS